MLPELGDAVTNFTLILWWSLSTMVCGALGCHLTRDDALSKPKVAALAALTGPGALYLV